MKKIKKKYIYLTFWTSGIVASALLVRTDVDDQFIVGILSVATFLFSALVATSLSERQRRIEQIREHDSVERAMISYIYQTSSVWGKSFQKEIQDLLDQYLVSIFIYKMDDYYLTDDNFQKLYQYILDAPVDTKKQQTAHEMLLNSFSNMTVARKQTIALFEDKLPKGELFASLCLGLFIIAGLMSFNTGSLSSIMIVIGLSSVVTVLVDTLFSLNSADYQYEQRILEPYQKTFESIGLLRYYPQEFIDIGKVGKLSPNSSYRVGVFAKPYPDISGFTIKTINPSGSEIEVSAVPTS